MMFRRIGLVPIIATAAFVVAGCNNQPSAEAPANNPAVTVAEANAAQPKAASSPGGAPTGGVCGGIQGIQCASAHDFCRHPAGQCNVADGQGTCTTKPVEIPAVYQPVCGCDHQTHGNPWAAARAGVSIQSQGECPAAAGYEANSNAAR